MTNSLVLRKWGSKALVSIADQGVYSGINFVLNILLVRWLSLEEYGAFSVAFSIFLFLSGFHNALILEPMSVIGPSRHSTHVNAYLTNLLLLNLFLTCGLGVVLTLSSIVGREIISTSSSSFLPVALLGSGLSTPLILFGWVIRRASYLQNKPHIALLQSIVYSLILLIGVPALKSMYLASAFSMFMLMGLASLVSGIAFLSKVGIGTRFLNLSNPTSNLRIIGFEHWQYGKWVVGSSFVYWLSSSIYLPYLGAIAGLAQAGIFRAMQNIILPLQQVLTGLNLFFLPNLAKQELLINNNRFLKTITNFSIVVVLFAVCYTVLLIPFGPFLIELLYGSGTYAQYSWILPYIGGIAIVSAFSQGPSLGLRSIQRPDTIFWSQVVGSVFSLTVGLYLVQRSGLLGAVLGNLLSVFLMTGFVVICIRKILFKANEQ